jgi:hypothetical protein
MKYYRIIVKDNEDSPCSYVYIATIDEQNGLSRINGLEVAETVVHSKIKEITNDFLETFLEGVRADIETSIILKDMRQRLSLHDIQIEELTENIDEKINGLIDGAPEALDTLKELSKALNNNPDFAANILQLLANLDTAIGTARNDLENKILDLNTIFNKKVDKETNKGLSTNDYTADEKNKLASIEENANKYIHPSYMAKTSGLYKITVDATGHVSAVTAVTKADITGLGIPASDTVYTHPSYAAKASGLYKITVDATGHVSAVTAVTKNDITELGIPAQDTTYGVVSKTAAGLAPKLPDEITTTKYLRQDGAWVVPPDTKYTHPSYEAKTSGLYKITVDATGHVSSVTAVTKADITGLGIPADLDSKADKIHEHTKSQITDFPTSMTPTAHDHDDRYYTESETDTKLTDKADKTTTYTKTEVTTLLQQKQDILTAGANITISNGVISAADIELFMIVTALPAIGEEHKIYLVSKTGSTGDTFDEYAWINNAWELLGTLNIDLSDYYTKTQTDTALDDKANTSHTHDDRYYRETEIDTKLNNKISKNGDTMLSGNFNFNGTAKVYVETPSLLFTPEPPEPPDPPEPPESLASSVSITGGYFYDYLYNSSDTSNIPEPEKAFILENVIHFDDDGNLVLTNHWYWDEYGRECKIAVDSYGNIIADGDGEMNDVVLIAGTINGDHYDDLPELFAIDGNLTSASGPRDDTHFFALRQGNQLIIGIKDNTLYLWDVFLTPGTYSAYEGNENGNV